MGCCALCRLMLWEGGSRLVERTNMELLSSLHSTTLADYAMRAQRDGLARVWSGIRVPGYLGTSAACKCMRAVVPPSRSDPWYSSRSGVQSSLPTLQPYQELHNTAQCIQCCDNLTAAPLIATLWRYTDTR